MADGTAQPKLTDKQERFVSAYIGPARFNATQAAIMSGYSERTAGQKGFELKNIEAIRARINEVLQANTLTAAEILRELTDVAMRDLDEEVEIRRFGKDENGDPIYSARMDASAKMKALELLGKHEQLFSENLNIHGGIEIREFVGIPEDVP